MDHSDLQVGCLGKFFKSRSRRIKSPRPKSSSQSSNSQATSIELSGECKGRSEVASESQQFNQSTCARLDAQQQKEDIQYFSPHCDYSYSPPNEWWSSTEPFPPSYSAEDCFSADNNVSTTIEQTVDKLNPKLRDLSLKIHGILAII